MKNTLITAVIVAVVVGGGAFFGGMQYQKSVVAVAVKQTAGAGNFGARGTRAGGAGFAGQPGSRPVSGDVLSVDGNSVTVKLTDGSSKIVILSQSSVISKSTMGSVADLKVGDRLMVFGQTNSDGSVTATSVQINTIMPGASGSGSPR